MSQGAVGKFEWPKAWFDDDEMGVFFEPLPESE
jgi:hypothetical protein